MATNQLLITVSRMVDNRWPAWLIIVNHIPADNYQPLICSVPNIINKAISYS